MVSGQRLGLHNERIEKQGFVCLGKSK